MTDLEKLKQTKIYMDRLADGLDPFSSEVLPQDTVLNNVQLSRCFFSLSDILRQVIDNGGIVTGRVRRSAALPPFSLSDDLRAKIEVTTTPTMIKHFTSRINGLVDDNAIQRLKVTAITTWLVNNGLLCEEIVNDKRRKKPTKAGEDLGIFSETREGHYGTYLAVLYNESAQRHIVSNLDQIIAVSNGE